MAALAVIRISGPDVVDIVSKVARWKGAGPLAQPRRLVRGSIVDTKGRQIDDALLVFMPGPDSYTGEDQAEIHCHGGEAVVAAVIDELLAAGARGADRGEFTRRALENGKMDLSRAEAVIQLICASTKEQVVGANRALGGELERAAVSLREGMSRQLARIEASIDFPDEEDVSALGPAGGLGALMDAAGRLVESVRRTPPQGSQIVFAGRPNVGKSSLINAVAGRKVSIVTSEPGTTRDAVTAGVMLLGVRLELVDTAGLGGSTGGAGLAEKEAARVAKERIDQAGLVVWVTDDPLEVTPVELRQRPHLLVVNKSDLVEGSERESLCRRIEDVGGLPVSARNGDGVETLRAKMARTIIDLYGPADGIPVTSRQEEAVRDITLGIRKAEAAIESGQPELAAMDIRVALDGVGRLLGDVVEIDVLDKIFSEFCIGK